MLQNPATWDRLRGELLQIPILSVGLAIEKKPLFWAKAVWFVFTGKGKMLLSSLVVPGSLINFVQMKGERRVML